MTALEQLQETCLALLFSTQAHPVGFSSLQVEDNASLASLLSEKEQQLLALYDKLRRVSLERRILEAAVSAESGGLDETSLSMKELEKELVEASANRQLKETVIDATLITHPILRAIHGPTASAKERGLLPLIQRRDTLSLTHANISHLLTEALKNLSEAEVKYCQLQEQNKVLASRLLELSRQQQEELKKQQGPGYEVAERDLKEAKKKWNMVKEVLQAIIVSSGVDWSRDEKLRTLVLTCGEEE
ncbi:centromere protein H (CENP-H)-domain-containing protein [Geopyxis carbonaria]|nr:centromere protein H (CENP-H)-domain-containing protein [Geopyxis carbonaria]